MLGTTTVTATPMRTTQWTETICLQVSQRNVKIDLEKEALGSPSAQGIP